MRIQVVLVVHRAVGALDLAVPGSRTLRNEPLWYPPRVEVPGERAPELAAVVGLDLFDGRGQIPFRQAQGGDRGPSVPRRHVHRILDVGHSVDEPVLVEPRAVRPRHVFHVNLEARLIHNQKPPGNADGFTLFH